MKEKTQKTENPELQTVFSKRINAEAAKSKKVRENATDETKKAWLDRFGQEKIDKWKSEHGNREIIALAVEGKYAALRPITADDLGDYMMAMGENGLSKAVAMIMEELWLEGDYELIENEDLFIAVFMQLNNILEGKKAEYFRA